METVKNIELKVVNSYILHHEVYGPEHPLHHLNNANPEAPVANISFTYDYERLPQDEWLFHADASISIIPYGNLLTRTSLQLTATPAELFSPPIMKLIIKTALETVTATFPQFSATNHFPQMGTIGVTDQLIIGFLQPAINTYTHHRAKNDINNHVLLTTAGLQLTPGGNTSLILKGTFIILDQILYENPAFNGEHNRNAIATYVPLPSYETVKWKCIQIDKQNVQLTWMDTMFLFLCLDCALQLLLGDHADTLTPGIEKFGMSELRRQEYITFSSEMLRVIKNQMKDKAFTILNLEDQIDWNRLMR
jgi:hypothetical protein